MNIPKHIVVFPDGNRRWAKNLGIASLEGHKEGYRNLITFTRACKNRGVKVITAFGFSTENWNRAPEEVSYLMKLLEEGLLESRDEFVREGVKVVIIGERYRLPSALCQAIDLVEKSTSHHQDFQLNLAISYGGKWDILEATKAIVKKGIAPENITEEIFENHLSTAGLPAPDLVIRAGGEMRLSNFVLWQAAYAELYFSPKFWPEFSEQDLDEALQEFDRRKRRFGK